MNSQELRDAFAPREGSVDVLFNKAASLSRFIQEHGPKNHDAAEHAIRLLAHTVEAGPNVPGIRNAVACILREVGLYPYVEPAELDWPDRLARAAFVSPPEVGIVFHREQGKIFERLVDGQSVILAAPTSFGKSILIDSVIAERKPDTVIIVVPTLALLDEARRRLHKVFGDRYQIITRTDQVRDPLRKALFVLTQERLFEREGVEEIDLLVIDEFYKLSPARGDDRTKLLNIVLHKFRRKAKQLLLLGPRIPNLSFAGLSDVVFIDDASITVASDIVDHSGSRSLKRSVVEVLNSHKAEKSIVYCRSPASLLDLGRTMVGEEYSNPSEECAEIASWLGENYHPSWSAASLLKHGIGVHHGGIPRSVAQWMIRLFDEGSLNVLLCTSTLIEGVNTKAKNVLIYDKKISNMDFDFVTFSNIKGRAGRMSKHLIGKVYLFHPPPPQTTFAFEIPGLMSPVEVSDNYIVNFDDAILDAPSRSRKDGIIHALGLPRSILDKLARYDIDQIRSASENTRKAVEARNPLIVWRGVADYDQLVATLTVAWKDLARLRNEPRTAKQAAFMVQRLRSSGTIRGFLNGLLQGKASRDFEKEIEIGLRALRNIEFHVPAVLSATQLLINHYRARSGLGEVDYAPMAAQIESYFMPNVVVAAEEIGIPIPLGQRLVLRDRTETLEGFIGRIRSCTDAEFHRLGLSRLEMEIARAVTS